MGGGSALSTGAAQMPPELAAPVTQGHWDTGGRAAHWRLPGPLSPTALASAQPFSGSNYHPVHCRHMMDAGKQEHKHNMIVLVKNELIAIVEGLIKTTDCACSDPFSS